MGRRNQNSTDNRKPLLDPGQVLRPKGVRGEVKAKKTRVPSLSGRFKDGIALPGGSGTGRLRESDGRSNERIDG